MIYYLCQHCSRFCDESYPAFACGLTCQLCGKLEVLVCVDADNYALAECGYFQGLWDGLDKKRGLPSGREADARSDEEAQPGGIEGVPPQAPSVE